MMGLRFRQLRRSRIDQPIEQPESERDGADAEQLFEGRCGKIQQDDFARDHQDRYQHDGSRLQYSGPSGDRERDLVIEFDQDQYAQ